MSVINAQPQPKLLEDFHRRSSLEEPRTARESTDPHSIVLDPIPGAHGHPVFVKKSGRNESGTTLARKYN